MAAPGHEPPETEHLSETVIRDPAHDAPAHQEGVTAPGRSFGPFQILRRLGQGGMGEVYEAEEVETGRRIALKVLGQTLQSRAAASRFLREGRLAASVSHPNSVYVFGTYEIGGAPAIAMELVAGGTLEQLVERDGPMAPGLAVDTIVQVIAGLEAAEKRGVLHRDIKPSNCFIDTKGTVKVGDYGLSVSSTGEPYTRLTVSGSFLGTPAYASPEQVRGGNLDVRSDIYSVGATLHFLVTGHLPFAKQGPMQMLAAILEEQPVSTRVYAPAVPEGLAQVVLQCLRKDPASRFQTYRQLRQALHPYASTPAETAPLHRRFVASLVDVLVLSLFPMVMGMFTSTGAIGTGFGTVLLVTLLLTTLLDLFYFGLLEGTWGASLGKRLCGIRVVHVDGGPPGIIRGMSRAGVFVLASSPELLLLLDPGIAAASRLEDLAPMAQAVLGIGSWIALALLFSTARRSNGWRAVHELISGTRTVVGSGSSRDSGLLALDSSVELNPVGDLGQREGQIGRYVIEGQIWSRRQEALLLGVDPGLQRQVWIHQVPPETPRPTPARQGVDRVTRPRWLASERSPEVGWDVFEAIEGSALPHEQPWARVREWLLDVAVELEEAAGDGSSPSTIALDRIWIGVDGTARLLDFPAPGATHESPRSPDGVEEAQRLLHAMAETALGVEGRAGLPLSGRTVLATLESRAYATHVDLRAAVEEAVDGPASVSRGGRAVGVIAASVFPVIILIVGLLIGRNEYRIRTDPTLDDFHLTLEQLARLERGTETAVAGAEVAAFRIHFGERHAEMITDDETWQRLGDLNAELRPIAERAHGAAVEASPDALASARVTSSSIVREVEGRAAERLPPIVEVLLGSGAVLLLALVAEGLVATIWTTMFRRSLGFQLTGYVVVDGSGERASRGRLAWRSLIAWSPGILGAMAFIGPAVFRDLLLSPNQPLPPGIRWLQLAVLGVLLILAIAGVAWTLLRPDRALQDKLAGTRVVPM